MVLFLVAQSIFVVPASAEIEWPSITKFTCSPRWTTLQLPITTPRTINITLNVTVLDPGNVPVVVNLSFSSFPHWVTTIYPESLWFNSSGMKVSTITVTVPANITSAIDDNIMIDAGGWYPNRTHSLEGFTSAFIYIETHHDIHVKFKYIERAQSQNIIEFTFTNKGDGPEEVAAGVLISYTVEDIEGNFSPNVVIIPAKGFSAKVTLTVRYLGNSWPATGIMWVGFGYGGPNTTHYLDLNVYVKISFIKPDNTRHYIFLGIVGTVDIIAVVICVILNGLGKGKKKKKSIVIFHPL